MKKTLIINLRCFGDIMSTSNLIKNLKGNDPTQQIYILTMSEYQKITDLMKGVEKSFTIDRQQILTLSHKKIYNDSRSLNSFLMNLLPINEIYWDNIINYSNDKIGTYICSYLKSNNTTAKIFGLHYDKHKNLVSSSLWSEIFNEVLTSYKHTPFHFVDLYNNISEVAPDENFWKIPKTLEKNDIITRRNFEQIRKHYTINGSAPKIIGIQLTASSIEKQIEPNEISCLINKILDNPEIYPVILIAPNKKEKEIAEKLSKEFDNSLVIVEADLNAIPSVIKQLDILATPDTLIKHIGDLFETPTVEVSRGSSPFLKQGTCNPNNYILSSQFSTRYSSHISENKISSNDIYQCILALVDNKNEKKISLSPGISLYRSLRDDLGINYKFITGVNEIDHELSRQISRQYLNTLVTKEISIKLTSQILEYKTSDIKIWINSQINQLTQCTKALLSTIRDLKQAQTNSKSGERFVHSLDRLISFADMSLLCSIPVALFRGRVDSFQSPKKEEIEKLSYELKNDLQTAVKFLKCLEESVLSIEKETLTNKYSRIVENTITDFSRR